MKKLISITVSLVILFSNFNIIAEEQQFSIADKIRSFMVVNNPEALAGIDNAIYKATKEAIEYHAYIQTMWGYEYDDQNMKFDIIRLYDELAANPEKTFCFYPLITIRYAKQYADSFNFDELISNERIWAIVHRNLAYNTNYDENYNETLDNVKIYDEGTIEFLTQPEMIEEMVREQINEKIVDCRIVALKYEYSNTSTENIATILYLKGENTDYGIEIYEPEYVKRHNIVTLERYKIYTMAELLHSCGSYEKTRTEKILDEKPTYETEAQTLMEKGLLQGNEKGLDPMKPLNRIEAVTLLVRALGLEDVPIQQDSMFSDIWNGHWGVKYANIAYKYGLTKGIGDGMFAPNQIIDANQFAAMILRNKGYKDFEWEYSLDALVDMGIITFEESERMDLFTRGDMAKIICEARAKGLM